MKNSAFVKIIMVTGVLGLTACGGSDRDETGSVPPEAVADAMVQKSVEELTLLDVNNLALNAASIQILTDEEWQKVQAGSLKIATNTIIADDSEQFFPPINSLPTATHFKGQSYLANAQGIVKLPKLAAGTYYVLVTKNGQSTVSAFLIHPKNTNKSIVLNVVLNCLDQDCQTLSDAPVNDAVVGTLSGQVIFKGKPLANAQVSLSGGTATNGAFVSALTDANGYFTLSFNVSNDLLEALKNATLTISSAGTNTITKKVTVIASSASGYQFEVLPETTSTDAVWRETFEADSATRNAWTRSQPSVANVDWQLLNKGHNIRNNQVNQRVRLAPNDQSQGKVPEPLQGNTAYWYGDKVNGNFIGALSDSSTAPEFDGGTSQYDNRGELISPSINLSQYQAPLSLSFKTWWEIESVNPNNQGFDLMNILVSTDGGNSFKTLARLNPLADPSSAYERAPIPYSNLGFNLAPAAVQQEAISLDEYAGKANVQLKFQFRTVDQLYNGFRGWMIDDVVIQKKAGTFPLFDGASFDENSDSFSQDYSGVAAKQADTVLKSTKSYARWAEVPQRK
ncbi:MULTISPECIES: carboxypeptidase regulatory-like domain-containing protein [unclassified Acinetobacter]|uniref:carboxypeptidase regulatory-like domain-containing protein n=1 Tax=unclassified Acinetobacter TaxID=196816 RepID=UPI0015D14A46|nr:MULTISPECIES: carboxypeptidase regulatory-like domain-containing protein [unclassified Acinetobacter]UUS61318.1 carboxypeptidase regulatory-like domain-containing protein [Acinetobacter sp. YH16056_T]